MPMVVGLLELGDSSFQKQCFDNCDDSGIHVQKIPITPSKLVR